MFVGRRLSRFHRHGLRFPGWGFPDKTVIVKSFAIEQEEGNPASRKWIETRLFQDRPPEDDARRQKGQVLKNVQPVMGEGRIE